MLRCRGKPDAVVSRSRNRPNGRLEAIAAHPCGDEYIDRKQSSTHRPASALGPARIACMAYSPGEGFGECEAPNIGEPRRAAFSGTCPLACRASVRSMGAMSPVTIQSRLWPYISANASSFASSPVARPTITSSISVGRSASAAATSRMRRRTAAKSICGLAAGTLGDSRGALSDTASRSRGRCRSEHGFAGSSKQTLVQRHILKDNLRMSGCEARRIAAELSLVSLSAWPLGALAQSGRR